MNPKKRLHVTGLLPILLPIKSLTVNDVTDVTPFPDLCINIALLAIFDHKSVMDASQGRLTASWFRPKSSKSSSALYPGMFCTFR